MHTWPSTQDCLGAWIDCMFEAAHHLENREPPVRLFLFIIHAAPTLLQHLPGMMPFAFHTPSVPAPTPASHPTPALHPGATSKAAPPTPQEVAPPGSDTMAPPTPQELPTLGSDAWRRMSWAQKRALGDPVACRKNPKRRHVLRCSRTQRGLLGAQRKKATFLTHIA